MYDCLGASLNRIECLTDNVLSRLSKYLNGHIIGDHVLIDKSSDKLKLGIG